jgi:hypothetical protein
MMIQQRRWFSRLPSICIQQLYKYATYHYPHEPCFVIPSTNIRLTNEELTPSSPDSKEPGTP